MNFKRKLTGYFIFTYFVLIFYSLSFSKDDGDLLRISNLIYKGISTYDSSGLGKISMDTVFDYFVGDIELDPKTVDKDFNKLGEDGYLGLNSLHLIGDNFHAAIVSVETLVPGNG